MRKKIFTVLAALCSLMVVNAADQTVNAGGDVAAAITATGGSGTVRIEVGTYTLADELTIPEGVTVIGGFSGGFEDENRIYPGSAVTTAEMTILDANSLVNTAPGAKHRVATVQGTLEGVVVRNGHVRDANGGGLLVDGGMVLNCIIKGNVAMSVTGDEAKGGGAYVQSDGKLVNCVVAYNMANNGYGVAGTGEIINNTITANTYAPSVVEVTGGTYKHFQHWRDGTNLPWEAGLFNPADYPTGNVDPTEITVSNFTIAETQTTTSQYAVFAAAMDLAISGSDVSFSDASLLLSGLTDPVRGETVGTYLGFTSAAGDRLFQSAGSSSGSYGLQLVGMDYIYYATRSNEAMTYVSWHGALAYSLWLGGSLPTEGQWEYAARYNGSSVETYLYAGSDILNDVAWNSANSGSRVKEVAGKAPNGIGLYDMSGNAWEWCADWINVTTTTGLYPTYTYGATPMTDPIWNTAGSGRVRRGGSWNFANGNLALAYRYSDAPTYLGNAVCFRPVFVP